MMTTDTDDFLQRYLTNIRAQYDASPSTPYIDGVETKTVKVACRDGIQLTTDLYMPSTPGPYPTIVVRNPYPQQIELWRLHGEELAHRGYALVCQWCRGTYTSQGSWEPNVNERNDGEDLLYWLESQDQFSSLALWGTSYLSLACWVLADITTPKVVSICANHYGTDRFSSAYQHGAFRSDVLTSWAMQNAGDTVEADYMQSVLHNPQICVDTDLWGTRLDWYRDWVSHPDADDPYWSEGFWGLLKGIPAKAKVPMFIQEGWFDHHLGSSLHSYEELNPEVKEHSWFKIGCWNHYFQNPLEGISPKNLNADEISETLEWFDLTVKQGKVPQKKVEFYEIGSDSWHRTSSWPPQSEAARQLEFFLDSSTNQIPAVHRLAAGALPTNQGAVEFDYDPRNPVLTHGGEALLATMDEIGAKIQDAPGQRQDIITFESAPLQSDVHIQGSISIDLYVSTSAPDTAFTAKLMCSDQNGAFRNYRTSITTIGAGTKSYVPGEVRKIRIEMWDISWMIPSGSVIRCDISSSDTPQYSVHTNFSGLWSKQDRTQIAHQKVLTGSKTPSCITFPVV
jgi:putative CocE/NonD family hydrolase